MADHSREAIYSAIGELAINWNFAESWIRGLAASYIGKDEALGEIFTLELGSVGLQNVLCAPARHCPRAGEAETLLHISTIYERIRGYRNYYVHGTIFALEYKDERAAAGFTHMKSAKGKLKVESARVEAQQIRTIADWCYDLGMYARQVVYHLHGNPQQHGVKPPLPDKPPLPPVLDKNAPYPQSLSSQPLASPE